MGLSKKTFLYSIILAVVMTAFVTGYFVFMLPSLYVDYVMRSNLKSAMEIHQGFARDRSYGNLTVKNPSSTYSLELPREGTDISISGKYFRLTVDVRDEELQTYLDRIKGMLKSMEKMDSAAVNSGSSGPEIPAAAKSLSEEDFAALWHLLKEKLTGDTPHTGDYPLAFEIEQKESRGAYREEYSRAHQSPDGFWVFEAGVSDDDYSYTTYIAFSAGEDAFLFTVLPTMTPQMDEIRPIVGESMPMIVAVVFLLVLLSSRLFSGKIVNPIIHLAGQAQAASDFPTDFSAAPSGTRIFDADRRDEIGVLSHALSELYEKLHGSCLALAEKNKILEEENLRQEVFLQATSHQLKTPVTAALLLVDGMRNRIGKYSDTDAWLPEVKKQLLSMRKIVEEVLYLNYHADQMSVEPSALEILLEELLNLYSVQIEAQKLEVHLTGSGTVCAHREILKKILDNLLSNAVQYTPPGGRIEITIEKITKKDESSDKHASFSQATLSIRNYGVTIPEELLPNIFEPFVSSSESESGKGLGLYVASYYCRLSGIGLSVENRNNCVCSLLSFRGDAPRSVAWEFTRKKGDQNAAYNSSVTGQIRATDRS